MALLTATEFKQHHVTTLPDAAVQRFIDSAESAITARRGPGSDITETRAGGLRLISLALSADRVLAVTERDGTWSRELDATDWEIRLDRVHLVRLASGTNPAERWAPRVSVTYKPYDDIPERIACAIALVKLDIAFSGYATSAETQPKGDYRAQRENILQAFALGGIPAAR